MTRRPLEDIELEYSGRYCKIFRCRKVGGKRWCCRDCPFWCSCLDACENDPSRCRQEDKPEPVIREKKPDEKRDTYLEFEVRWRNKNKNDRDQ